MKISIKVSLFGLISKFSPTNLGAVSDEDGETSVSGVPSIFADI
jgi:hypothetical protein